MVKLKENGFNIALSTRRATHEFIVTLKNEAKNLDVNAMDFAKRLLDYGFHAPTTYFPLIVPECLLIEPTETESKEILDQFISTMVTIRTEAQENPELVKNAPYSLPVKRLDDVKAARELNLVFRPETDLKP
jgi:glycine dehydrogenase subunit 2